MTRPAQTFSRLGQRPTTFRIIMLVTLVLVAVAGHAQPQLPNFPPSGYGPEYRNLLSASVAPPQGGVPITFSSPQEGATELAIPGILFRPTGTPKGAVVIVNAAGGWSDGREGHYGRSLSSAGYVVLAIDTYGPRAISGTQADNTKLTTYAQTRDAFAARRYLVSIGYAADRIAIMGTGRGGTIALLAADRTFVQDEKERFPLAMAVSAGCIFHPRQPKPGATIYIAIGERDDVGGVKPCKDLANEYAAAGGKVEVKVYPGASNGFDGHPAMVRLIHDPLMESFVDCNVLVEPSGRSTFNGKSFAESDSGALIVEMRKSCIKRGASGWTNLTQKANVTLDLIEFLDSNLRH